MTMATAIDRLTSVNGAFNVSIDTVNKKITLYKADDFDNGILTPAALPFDFGQKYVTIKKEVIGTIPKIIIADTTTTPSTTYTITIEKSQGANTKLKVIGAQAPNNPASTTAMFGIGVEDVRIGLTSHGFSLFNIDNLNGITIKYEAANKYKVYYS